VMRAACARTEKKSADYEKSNTDVACNSQSCARFNQAWLCEGFHEFWSDYPRSHNMHCVGDPTGPLNEGGVHPNRDHPKSEAMTHILASTLPEVEVKPFHLFERWPSDLEREKLDWPFNCRLSVFDDLD
jgi:hypothetical protein